MDMFERLADPPVENRPIPFWSWNDKLEIPELLRQMREMARVGVGGFFMHARGGLETEYLGEAWMAAVEACVHGGRALGLEPWLYDEEGWPSGFAGGAVPARGSERFGRWLVIDRAVADARAAASAEGFLGAFQLDGEGGFRRLNDTESDTGGAAAASGEIVVVRQVATPYYIDVLDEETVDAFIAETHERYAARFGDGESVAGFFTDEPRFSGSIDRDPPWSLKLPARFRSAYGYEVLEVLPALFLPLRGHEKVRYDYYALASRLFVDNFTGRIGDWCRERDLELTGHLMMEESVFVQAANTAGVMPHYARMDVPGVDWLRRPIGSPIVPKQVGSVASQLGKKRVITESFALAGWDVSFEELKRIVEWQYVNGVNLLCQHLSPYSLRGFRKRDYPPALFFQQPWWGEYKIFNDYVARLGMLLGEGTQTPRVLLLHPMRSGWVLYDGQTYTEEFKKLDQDFVAAAEALSGAHVEYHLGDETIMATHGSVDGGALRIGLRSYEAVVLPSLRCIASSTLDLLESFVESGGFLVSAGDLPTLVDGMPSPRLKAVLGRLPRPAKEGSPGEGSIESAVRDAVAAIRRRLPGLPSVRELSAAGVAAGSAALEEELAAIHLTERILPAEAASDPAHAWFFVNLDQNRTYDARIELPLERRMRLYRCEDGSFAEIEHSVTDGRTVVDFHFEPMRSCILVLDEPAPAAKASPPEAAAKIERREMPLDGEWDIDECDLNALTLDSCSFRIDGGERRSEKPLIHLMQELLELKRPCDVELRFSFDSALDGSELSTLFLALEKADEFKIEANGRPVPYRDEGWWMDGSFRRVDLRPLIRRGRNELILSRGFFQRSKVYEVLFGSNVYETEKNKLTYDVELESVYLVGDFGVASRAPFVRGPLNSLRTDGPFRLVERPRRVRAGALAPQGFPFFAGAITLSKTIRINKKKDTRYVLPSRPPRAVLSRVSLNGTVVATRPWAPFDIDITDALRDGENRLSIRLWSGNRNLLGPHHHVDGEPLSVGPESFTGRWSWVEKRTEAVPATAEERTRSYWKGGFAFVDFGVMP